MDLNQSGHVMLAGASRQVCAVQRPKPRPNQMNAWHPGFRPWHKGEVLLGLYGHMSVGKTHGILGFSHKLGVSMSGGMSVATSCDVTLACGSAYPFVCVCVCVCVCVSARALQ